MTDIATHIRIFNPNPDDDFVTKRIAAIKGIEAEFKKKKNVDDILKLASDIASSTSSTDDQQISLTALAEAAIKKQSDSFISEGQQLQIRTCILLGALQYVENSVHADNNLSKTDVLGIAIWNGLSFQAPLNDKPRLETLREELIQKSQEFLMESSLRARKRRIVNTSIEVPVPEDNLIQSFAVSLKSHYGKAMDNLTTNALLDREELNVLWWTLGEWSELAKKSMSQMTPVQRAVICGVELAGLLRRVPGQAHRNLIMRFIPEDSILNGAELIEQLGDIIGVVRSFIERSAIVISAPQAFPLFQMLLAGDSSSPDSIVKRPLSEWASRALLEGAMVNFNNILDDGR